MSWKRGALVLAGVGGALGAVVGAGYALQRKTARGWRADAEALAAAGLALPGDVEHHFVPVDDGGRIHAVERGEGPPLVLVHGVTLGVATWAPQLRHLAASHRVIAIGQRGHGQSIAGADGYSFDRLALDVLEVLEGLDVHDAVYVGHSMGGMVGQTAALNAPARFGQHVAGLVLAATSAGPLVPGRWSAPLIAAMADGAERGLGLSERRGTLFPSEDLGAWATRAAFGSRPRPTDLELTRAMISAMSPTAMAALIPSLLAFDLHQEIAKIELPTHVVVGTRDLMTPPRMARHLARGIPGAGLTVYDGCGHMVMLERPEELNLLLHRFSEAVAPAA